MGLSAKIKEIVQVDPEDFPRIAVNALKTLGYRSDGYDKHDNKLIYIDPHEEVYISESWSCLYQVILTWTEIPNGIDLTISVKEKNYGEDHIDVCIQRAEKLYSKIQKNIERAKSMPKKQPAWKVRFATTDDLHKDGLIVDRTSSIQSDLSSCFLLGKHQSSKIRLPSDLTHRHVLVCGPTGSGKSTAIFIPNLIERTGCSAIVTEAVSGSSLPVLYKSTAGWRSQAGHRVIYFNPDDKCTMRINPVDLVRNFDDAQHIANLIITNTTAESHRGDQIWSQAETHLLQSLLMHVASFRSDLSLPSVQGDNANIGYIRRLMRRGPEGMMTELSESKLVITRSEYSAFLNNTSPNFRYGVVSGLISRLNLFINDRIAAATEVTDFDLNTLKDELFTVYLAIPIHRPEFSPLAALMFNFFLSFALANISSLKYPLTLFLDEFTNFGYIPGMARYLTVIRNAGVGAVLGIQDIMQLEKTYREKDARIIFSQPRTKIFFSPADDFLAQRISKMVGYTSDQESVTASGQLANKETPRYLLDSQDLMQMDKNKELLVVGMSYPLKLNQLHSWIDYADPVNYCPPNLKELHIPNYEHQEQLVSKSTADPNKYPLKESWDNQSKINKPFEPKDTKSNNVNPTDTKKKSYWNTYNDQHSD